MLGYSGGGPHALACAGADPRAVAAAVIAGLAPRDADGIDWYDGMIASGRRVLTAAEAGDAERRAAEDDGYDPEFTAADLRSLDEGWEWLGRVAGAMGPDDLDGAIDDDMAYVRDWRAEVDAITAPVLVVHGEADRIVPPAHGRWLAARMGAELRLVPDAGHISILEHAPQALSWLAAAAHE